MPLDPRLKELQQQRGAMTPAQRQHVFKQHSKTGYYAPPGTGPDGKCCKHCKHFYRNHQHSKTYFKCDRVKWTHGAATDIKANAEACHGFEEGSGDG